MVVAKKKTESGITHNDDPFLSLSEVARQIGVSPSTVGRWCTDGLLVPVRRPSGLRAVRQSEVNRFLGGSALDKQVQVNESI